MTIPSRVRANLVTAMVLCVGSRGGESAGREAGPGVQRVVSWNIRHGVGMDGRLDLDRAAAVLRGLEPAELTFMERIIRCDFE